MVMASYRFSTVSCISAMASAWRVRATRRSALSRRGFRTVSGSECGNGRGMAAGPLPRTGAVAKLGADPETKGVASMTRDRFSGTLLILGSILMVAVMALHPTGSDILAAPDVHRAVHLATGVHL